jgi:hypothetical protein
MSINGTEYMQFHPVTSAQLTMVIGNKSANPPGSNRKLGPARLQTPHDKWRDFAGGNWTTYAPVGGRPTRTVD